MNAPGDILTSEYRFRHADGSWRHLESVGNNLLHDPDVRGIVINSRDITERKQAEDRYRTLVEQIPAVIYINPPDGTGSSIYISPQIENLLGYSVEENRENPSLLDSLLHPEDRERVIAEEVRTSATGEPFGIEYRMISRDGRVVWVRDETILVRDGEGRSQFWQGVILDITEQKELEDQLAHQAFHDTLTGLPNRVLFTDRLQHALDRRSREERSVAVLFVDLDDFKTINDSLGHAAGDRLLAEVAGRLSSCIRPGDTVARLGGDEFAVLIEDVLDPDDDARESAANAAVLVAERILQTLKTPFALQGKEVIVRPSIGIATDLGEKQADELLQNADVAMYTAKGRGKGRYEFYDPGMHAAVLERLELGADLRRAVARREFVVHYQPIVALEDPYPVREVEALVRWEHPQRGLVPPGKFIPLAEDTGVIIDIGYLVLEEACCQVRRWQESSAAPLTLNVNLSARQFRQPDLVERISGILRETDLPANCLKLEVTESVAMEDVEMALVTLWRLKDLGIQVAIDDFGTGYSSLSQLGRLPVDTLKIDRSFVSRLEEDAENAAIISTTANLGHALGLDVTAEGVETAGQLAFLRELGCDLAQGYYLSRPLPAGEIPALLAAGSVLESRRS